MNSASVCSRPPTFSSSNRSIAAATFGSGLSSTRFCTTTIREPGRADAAMLRSTRTELSKSHLRTCLTR